MYIGTLILLAIGVSVGVLAVIAGPLVLLAASLPMVGLALVNQFKLKV